jgi:hypothetical protein
VNVAPGTMLSILHFLHNLQMAPIHNLDLKGLKVTNTLAYRVHSVSYKKIKCCEYGPWDHIVNTSFSSYLTNGPNTLECYIMLGMKGWQVTNTLAYWVHFVSYKKIKCCKYP